MVATPAPMGPTQRQIAQFWARRGSIKAKFWLRVGEQGAGCWLWQGALGSWGYGVLRHDGRTRHAHRVSWEINVGPIPDGIMVCHRCDVRACVRPDHLFLGTAKDNSDDMIAKGRRGKGWRAPKRGETHPAARFSDAQVAEMRVAIDAGDPHRAIARRFGVSHTYIDKLARGTVRVG